MNVYEENILFLLFLSMFVKKKVQPELLFVYRTPPDVFSWRVYPASILSKGMHSMISAHRLFETINGSFRNDLPILPLVQHQTDQGTYYVTRPSVQCMSASHSMPRLVTARTLSAKTLLLEHPLETRITDERRYSVMLHGISHQVACTLFQRHPTFTFSPILSDYSEHGIRFVEHPLFQHNLYLHHTFLRRIDALRTEYAILVNDLHDQFTIEKQHCASIILTHEKEAPLLMHGSLLAWHLFFSETMHAESELQSLALRIFVCLAMCEPELLYAYDIESQFDDTYVLRKRVE